MISYIIGGILIGLGILALYKSIKKEVKDGCYACPSKGSCDSENCGNKNLLASSNPKLKK